MKEKVIELFDRSGKPKVEFDPPIRIKMTHSYPVWIDKMTKIKDAYLVSITNQKDKMIKNINSIDENLMNSLHIRLYSLYGNTETKS